MFTNSNIKVDRDRCLACGECVDRCIMDNLRLSVAPCRQSCPLLINCQGYARLVAQGKPEDAAERLRNDTPFAALLGRVCHHPCESVCERHTGCHDGAVHLRALKLHLAETFPEKLNAPAERAAATGKSVGIVGSGPAGLMAAHELAAKGHAVTVYEAKARIGGLLRYAIPAYRLPDAVIDAMQTQLEAMGVVFKTGTALGSGVTLAALRQQHQAVLVSVGLGEALRLPACGDGVADVRDALSVLAALRGGEAATFASAGDAVVVGGGNTAMDVALSLKKAGVARVTVVSLEGPHELPVHPEELEEVREAGVTFLPRWGVKSVTRHNGRLSLTLNACLTPFDEAGRFAPQMDSTCERTLEGALVVSAVGQKVDAALRTVLGATDGRLPLHLGEGLFAAGDCVSGASSVVDAMAAGKDAAVRMDAFLNGEPEAGGRTRFDSEWDARGMVRTYESLHERAVGGPRCARPKRAATGLDGVTEQVLTAEEARQQAERCLACGRAYEANFTCWFCLPCEIDCPAEALSVSMPYQVR